MNTSKDKENTIWYAVFGNNTIKKYENPLKKIKNKYWIKQEDTGKRYIANISENVYEIYSYEILNKSLNPTKIELNGWKIIQIYDPPKVKHAFIGTYAVFTDPLGELRTEMVHWINSALELLSEISKFDNWQHYDLKMKNDNLLRENESLKNECDTLNSLIDTFKNTDLFQKINESYEVLNEKETSKIEIKAFCDKFQIDKIFIDRWL